MRYITLVCLWITILFIHSCAQNTSFVSAEGKFSIDLANSPVEDKNSPEARMGGKKLWWKTEGASFMVSYVDNQDAKEDLGESVVKVAADGYISALPKAAEIVSRKNIELEGYPGVEIMSKEKDGYTAVTRYYMAKTRLYCVMALWSSGSNDEGVIRIVDSFQIR